MKILFFLLLSTTIYAKQGIDIADLIKPSFPFDITVTKQQFTLNGKELKTVQKLAKAKLDSKTIRMYTAKKGKNVVGYAVLIIQTIRTKKAAVLYVIDKKENIKNIEIVAFNEPLEYKPKDRWKSVFKGKNLKDNLFSGKGIPTISGSTLSARTFADAARIALAIIKLYK